MPSLIRFLSFLGLLAAAVCGGMVAFAGLVEPTQREFVVLVPQDRMGKKVVSNSRRRTGRAGGPTGDVEEGWVPVGCCPSWSEHLDHGNLVAVSSVGSKCPALVSMMCSASSPGDAVVSSRRAGSGAQAPLSTGTILPGERFRTLGLRADLEPAPGQHTCVLKRSHRKRFVLDRRRQWVCPMFSTECGMGPVGSVTLPLPAAACPRSPWPCSAYWLTRRSRTSAEIGRAQLVQDPRQGQQWRPEALPCPAVSAVCSAGDWVAYSPVGRPEAS